MMNKPNEKQLANLKQYRTGESTGRPPGVRNKLSTRVLNDFLMVWEEGGLDGLRRLMKRQPGLMLRAAVQMMPKEITHRTEGALAKLTNEQLEQFIADTRRRLIERSIRTSAEGAAEEAGSDEPRGIH
jgi:hypothetical protein